MRSFVLRFSCLTILVSLLGCGGGSKGSGSSSGNPTIFSSVQNIGSAGGSLVNDDGTVSVVVPPGTLAEGSTVALEEQQHPVAGITPSTASGLPHAVTVSLDPSAMTDGSAIQIDVPQLKPYDEFRSTVFAFSTTDRPLPLDTHLDIASGKVVASLSKTELLELASPSRARARGTGVRIGISLSFLGPNLAVQPYGEFYHYVIDPKGAGRWDLVGSNYAMPSGRIAIVVHGISNDVQDMKDLARFLARDLKDQAGNAVYTEVWGYNYNWLAHIDESGDRFSADLLAKINSASEVNIYGHSMGGLVSRWALEKTDLGQSVHRLVTLDTPHEGVPQQILKYFVNFVGMEYVTIPTAEGPVRINFIASTGGLQDLVPPVIDPFHNAFLTRLNDSGDNRYHTTANYYSLGGTHYHGYLGPLGDLANWWYNLIDSVPNDGIVPTSSQLSTVLGMKSDSWQMPFHRATVDLTHSQVNGDPDNVAGCSASGSEVQCQMESAVKPFILASLTGTVK